MTDAEKLARVLDPDPEMMSVVGEPGHVINLLRAEVFRLRTELAAERERIAAEAERLAKIIEQRVKIEPHRTDYDLSYAKADENMAIEYRDFAAVIRARG